MRKIPNKKGLWQRVWYKSGTKIDLELSAQVQKLLMGPVWSLVMDSTGNPVWQESYNKAKTIGVP